MKLTEARIGYAGYSRGLRAPGDRRRFCAYAAARGIAFEPADLRHDYDLMIVTHNGDIPGWTARKRREGDRLRYVFELADSYFTQTGLLRRLAKGCGRFALGMDSRLSPDFLKTLIRACEQADAVICSTEEQRAMIGRYNPQVFTSFDFFGDDLAPPKSDYGRPGKLRLVWEGQSTTLYNIQSIRDVLNKFRDRIELHVVTDPIVPRFFGRFGGRPTVEQLHGIECDIRFHRWALDSFASHIVAADLAIIPIDVEDAFAGGKPENKLVMLWQLGLPVLASATPAYRRTMEAAGVDMACSGPEEWCAALERMIAAPAHELERVGRACRDYATKAYSRREFLRRFDTVFEAVGFSLDQSTLVSSR